MTICIYVYKWPYSSTLNSEVSNCKRVIVLICTVLMNQIPKIVGIRLYTSFAGVSLDRYFPWSRVLPNALCFQNMTSSCLQSQQSYCGRFPKTKPCFCPFGGCEQNMAKKATHVLYGARMGPPHCRIHSLYSRGRAAICRFHPLHSDHIWTLITAYIHTAESILAYG